MSKSTISGVAGACVAVGLLTGFANAQSGSAEDAAIAQIQPLASISPNDQQRISRWVENRIGELREGLQPDQLVDVKPFRNRVKTLYEDSTNSPEFRRQLAVQTAQIAETEFGKADLESTVASALARVLVDMSHAEAFRGLVAGLQSRDRTARYLCVTGLVAQQASVAADGDKLNQTVAALRAAGVSETDPTVLCAIYRALAFANQVDAVFDAYMALFDSRLEARRRGGIVADRAELDAFDFFRLAQVINALSAERKSALASRLAVFLRLDAERYNTGDIGIDEHFGERDHLERRLDGAEAGFEALLGADKGGNIRSELRSGGHEQRDAVLQQAYRWVGNPTTQKAGALNTAPWNVPIGAP
jgi:hypothetical protein